jgi:hypothetical protein
MFQQLRSQVLDFSGIGAKEEVSDKDKWNDRFKNTVVKRLLDIICQRTLNGFAMSVTRQDYDELVQGDLWLQVGAHHYPYAVRCVIGFIEKWRVERGITEPTEYIFDRMTNGESKKEIQLAFEHAEDAPDALHRYGIYKGCLSFRDKSEISPLRAADMTAWCVFRRDHQRRTKKELP